MDSIYKIISNRGRGELTGIPTGFTVLDNLMRGLQNEDLIVIAGDTGIGKTSMALNMVESAIFGKKCVHTLIFSLEMNAKQICDRIISSRARVDQHSIREGYVPKTVLEDINKVVVELKDSPLWIDDTADMTIFDVRNKARCLQQKLSESGEKIGLIVVDYLQLLKAFDFNVPRQQIIAEMARELKAMAREISVPVVVLSQINRKSGSEMREPCISDLYEAGSIEHAADVILLLSWQKKSASYNELYADNSQRLVKVEIAKQRNGPTGAVRLIFNRNFTRYENYLEQKDDQ